jgi:hypothetical protein
VPRANFFHGSTDVRASSLGRSLSKHTAMGRTALSCVLLVCSVHGAEIGRLNGLYEEVCPITGPGRRARSIAMADWERKTGFNARIPFAPGLPRSDDGKLTSHAES